MREERVVIGVVRGGKVELPEGHGLHEGEKVLVLTLEEAARKWQDYWKERVRINDKTLRQIAEAPLEIGDNEPDHI